MEIFIWICAGIGISAIVQYTYKTIEGIIINKRTSKLFENMLQLKAKTDFMKSLKGDPTSLDDMDGDDTDDTK